MAPQDALELQLRHYREMTCEERVGIALRLHELACEMARLGIRHQNPDASPAEVEEMLRRRLEFARSSRHDDEAWEHRLAYPEGRPRLEAFLRDSAAEGDEPLDLTRL